MRFASVRGFSLIELLIVAAVMALFFGGLFTMVQNSLQLLADSRGRLAALSIANNRIEYIRSLSYDAVGTVSGIPNGLIPQVATSSLNDIEFTEQTLIEYVDDPADGIGAADANSITTDYKRVKVTIRWNVRGEERNVFLVTTVVPRSIETNVGGGTIRVNVFDAGINPLTGASVRLRNTTGTSSIDVTKTTDATGVVLFGGAPAGGGYEIFVTRDDFSSDQTRIATGTLANPLQQPVAVAEADISTVSFFIDRLGGLDVMMYTDRVIDYEEESFSDMTGIASSSNANIVGGGLRLAGATGSYQPAGFVFIGSVTPAPLVQWYEIRASSTIPSQTTVLYRVYSVASSSYELVPDTDLSGNNAGFSTDIIDLRDLSTTTYPNLAVGVFLTTTDSNVSPVVDDVTIYYSSVETPLADTSLTLQGTKTIGTTIDPAVSVFKNTNSITTDGGVLVWPALEWDAYTITTPSYDIAESCGSYPMVVNPGATTTMSLVVKPDTPNSLRVIVQDSLGQPIPQATVTVSKGEGTKETSLCGQVYFDSVNPAPDYTLTISKAGYTTVVVDPLDISGDMVQVITL